MHQQIGQTHAVKIQGPLGKGLGIQQTGKHIALAGGTGVLVFIDLVAHLIWRLKLADENNRPTSNNEFPQAIDLNRFQFVLYTSFGGERDRIGVELCQTLEELCRVKNLPKLFRFVDREIG